MEEGKRVRMEARRGKWKERRMVEEEERVRMEGKSENGRGGGVRESENGSGGGGRERVRLEGER